MLKSIKISALALALSVVSLLQGTTASAVNPEDEARKGFQAAGGAGQQLTPQIQNIVNILLFIIGAIAVIMIVVGGLRYVLSDGDSARIKSAKDTILYSVIGVIVALLAYAIVNFVLNQFA